LECLATVLEDDDGEARELACCTVALLAKSVECRETIVEDPKIVDWLARILGGTRGGSKIRKKKQHQSSKATISLEEKKEDHEPLKQAVSQDTKSALSGEEEGTEFREDRSRSFDDDETSCHSQSMASRSQSMARSSHHGEEESEAEGDEPSSSSSSEDDETLGTDEEEDDDETKRTGAEESTVGPSTLGDGDISTIVSMASIRKERYRNDEYFQRARNNACAALSQLSKHCAVSQSLCDNDVVLHNVLLVANETTHVLHTKCLELLVNFSRFPANNARLADFPGLVSALMAAGNSEMPAESEYTSYQQVETSH